MGGLFGAMALGLVRPRDGAAPPATPPARGRRSRRRGDPLRELPSLLSARPRFRRAGVGPDPGGARGRPRVAPENGRLRRPVPGPPPAGRPGLPRRRSRLLPDLRRALRAPLVRAFPPQG